MREVLRCRRITPDWPALLLAYVGLRSRWPLTIRTNTGPFELHTPSDTATFWLIHVARTYPAPRGATLIVDAGANIGAFALYALQHAPGAHVVAIEPAPDSFARLTSVLKQNGLESRCTAIRSALGGQPGTTTIDLKAASQFRRSGHGGAEVPVITLEQIVAEHGPIDLLKLDAEGAEYEALGKAPVDTLKQISEIAMEYHPVYENGAQLHPIGDLLARLATAGFTNCDRQDHAGGYGVVRLSRNPDLPES